MPPIRCCVSKTHKISNTLFGIPVDPNLKRQWEEALGITLKKSFRVCETHFKQSDVINTWESGKGENKYTISLKRHRLKKGAIPLTITTTSYNIEPAQINEIQTPGVNEADEVKDHDYYKNTALDINQINEIPTKYTFESPCKLRKVEKLEMTNSLYELISKNISIINVPNNWYASSNNSCIAFHKLTLFQSNYRRYIEKQLIITEDSEIIVQINNKNIALLEIGVECEELNNVEGIQQLLLTLDKVKCCVGATTLDNTDIKQSFGTQLVECNDQWFHINCLTVVKDGKKHRCLWCSRLLYSLRKKLTKVRRNKEIRTHFSPNQQKKLQQLVKSKKKIERKNLRASKHIIKLQYELDHIKNKMNKLTETTLDMLENSGLPICQIELIKDIFLAAYVKYPKN